MTKNILLIGGSLNQTTIMHKISQHLSEYNCYFTPYYADSGLVSQMAQAGWVNFSILGGRHRKATEAYLSREKLPVDFGGRARDYDAVITGTDVLIQSNIRGKRLVLVQEGMMEPESLPYFLVRYLKFPRYIANTASTGLSNAYDRFCVASPGYRDLFLRKGVPADKLIVTGIPNFDNAKIHLKNRFPYRHFVLVATSSNRETLKFDNRISFLEKSKRIAGGRPVIFKLHPNENHDRAIREIHSLLPDALIYTDGNINDMIANCDVLITQSSSVVFTGIALRKEVYSDYDPQKLKALLPVQNGGKSAQRIAEVSRHLIQLPEAEFKQIRQRKQPQRKWQLSDLFSNND